MAADAAVADAPNAGGNAVMIDGGGGGGAGAGADGGAGAGPNDVAGIVNTNDNSGDETMAPQGHGGDTVRPPTIVERLRLNRLQLM